MTGHLDMNLAFVDVPETIGLSDEMADEQAVWRVLQK